MFRNGLQHKIPNCNYGVNYCSIIIKSIVESATNVEEEDNNITYQNEPYTC